MRVLAYIAILPAGATFYFFVFWRWFDTWLRHRVLIYTIALGTFVALGVAVHRFGDLVFADRVGFAWWARAAGWALIVMTNVLGFVADRQIGFRVRSFTPFFERADRKVDWQRTGQREGRRGRIELETNGAYGVVRHPIYAAGIGFQAGAFLVTGYVAVAVACAVLALGALWFTRQEERRLVALLDDPAAYERYRRRVPALFPLIRHWP